MNVGVRPEWDLTDRLVKSMRHAGLKPGDLAERIGVHRNTISNYTSGRVIPDRRTVIAWSLATGVRLDWLLTGHGGDDDNGPTDGSNGVTREYLRSAVQVTKFSSLQAASRRKLDLPLRKVA